MSMMGRIYVAHNGEDMTEEARDGLAKLLDMSRVGSLDAGEVEALTTSPALRDWVSLQSSAFGSFALAEWREGRPAGIGEWFAKARPQIAAQIVQAAR